MNFDITNLKMEDVSGLLGLPKPKVQKFRPCNTDENLEGGHWLDVASPEVDKDAEYRVVHGD